MVYHPASGGTREDDAHLEDRAERVLDVHVVHHVLARLESDGHLWAKRAEAPRLGTFYMCFEGF